MVFFGGQLGGAKTWSVRAPGCGNYRCYLTMKNIVFISYVLGMGPGVLTLGVYILG